MSKSEKSLTEFEEKLWQLKKKRDELSQAAERSKMNRNLLNDSTNKLRTEAHSYKEKRDQANQKISELKKKIETLMKSQLTKKEKLDALDARIEEENVTLPRLKKTEDRLKNIEWEIMTTPTQDMKDREKTLIEESKMLRKTLESHEDIDVMKDERLQLLAELKAVDLQIKEIRNNILQNSKESGENHEKMKQLYGEADKEHQRADKAHEKFLEYLSQVKDVNEKLTPVLKEIKLIQEKEQSVKQEKDAARKLEMEKRKRELILEAKSKLTRGEKTSLEELKLIYQEEEDKD